MNGDMVRNVLPDINWEMVYAKMGMTAQYAHFQRLHRVQENPSTWTIPVLEGLTCEHLISVNQSLGIVVWCCVDNIDKEIVDLKTRAVPKGSYAVRFNRNIDADMDTADIPADVLTDRQHLGMAPIEWFLLDIGCYTTFHQHLDRGSITMCPNFRFSGRGAGARVVPGIDWDNVHGKIFVFGYKSSDCEGGALRSRTASFWDLLHP